MKKERRITTHHDGHGLTESIEIYADAPGPGGASHYYQIEFEGGEPVQVIQFQEGPRGDRDSKAGIVEGVLLAILIDRLEAFQNGPYVCRENAIAKTHLEEALMWIKQRAHNRAQRGVLGTTQK